MLNKSEIFIIVIGVLIVGSIIIYQGGFLSKKPYDTKDSIINKQSTQSNMEEKNISTDPNIQIIDVAVGTGVEAVPGKVLSVHYTGTFEDGTKFDSSHDRGEPIEFPLGMGGVIKGWDVGLAGMKVGGKRHLIISPEYGYGPNDYGPIPGNSTLIFDVELVEVK